MLKKLLAPIVLVLAILACGMPEPAGVPPTSVPRATEEVADSAPAANITPAAQQEIEPFTDLDLRGFSSECPGAGQLLADLGLHASKVMYDYPKIDISSTCQYFIEFTSFGNVLSLPRGYMATVPTGNHQMTEFLGGDPNLPSMKVLGKITMVKYLPAYQTAGRPGFFHELICKDAQRGYHYGLEVKVNHIPYFKELSPSYLLNIGNMPVDWAPQAPGVIKSYFDACANLGGAIARSNWKQFDNEGKDSPDGENWSWSSMDGTFSPVYPPAATGSCTKFVNDEGTAITLFPNMGDKLPLNRFANAFIYYATTCPQ